MWTVESLVWLPGEGSSAEDRAESTVFSNAGTRQRSIEPGWMVAQVNGRLMSR